MSDLFVDRLLEAIARKKAPVCVGIDPIFEMLPDAIAGDAKKRDANDLDACLYSIHDFCRGVLETVAPLVPAVKFQSAYFEQYLWEGVEAYYELVQEAKDLGLLVIGDVKRGDIGSTSEAYANAHLAPHSFPQVEHISTPDAITINPMLGMDSIAPFVKVAKETGKGLFVLVRTSNPGSADFQDAKLQDGRTWSEALADRLQPEAEAPGLVGNSGWSNIGAVVGATQPHTIESFRARLPKSIFLLPGYGTQGATADMTRKGFKSGCGGLVSASRSILYPKATSTDWRDAVRKAAERMIAEVRSVLQT
ncbi:MAG: orotidine-5'-phosphate decarboxylase [Anaerolineae bacterium]|nr:orotidine-5'-phosphate decarboxylase [Phycisphaerae bacterium]